MDVLAALSNGIVLLFALSTMLAMGLRIPLVRLLEPLRDLRTVALALAANLIVVPLLAVALAEILPLSSALRIGLVILGACGGAPFLPKLAEVARADEAFALALMTLLVIATVVYAPLALPILVPGASVDAAPLALSLGLTMLLPLALAVLARARYPEESARLEPLVAHVSSLAMVLVTVTSILTNLPSVVGLLGTGGVLAALVLVVGGLASGYLLGGPIHARRVVVALGTGQRNVAAALLIATQGFGDGAVLAMVMVGSIVSLLVVLPIAAELGRRASDRALESAQPTPLPRPPETRGARPGPSEPPAAATGGRRSGSDREKVGPGSGRGTE